MQFLDLLGPHDRDRLLQAGRVIHLAAGSTLLEQGQAGGDIYLIEAGSFEVVDTRAVPQVVLAVLGPGAIVGEMAFLDTAPRAADVRATEDGSCRLWEKPSLERLLAQDAALGVAFYRALAHTIVDRNRTITQTAVAGGIGPAASADIATDEAILRRAHDLSRSTQGRWLEAESALRKNTSDSQAPEEVRATFADLCQSLTLWLETLPTRTERAQAGKALSHDLRPYLRRSTLAGHALDAPARESGDPRMMAHLLLDEPHGDGLLGLYLDQAILALPTMAGVRARTATATKALLSALPADGPINVSFVNSATGVILASALSTLARLAATVTCVDGNREALAFIDAGLATRPPTVSLRLALDDMRQPELAALAPGSQHAIVLDGLLDYLPDRLTATTLATAASRLAPGGQLIVATMQPSSDAPICDWLLDWPLVRREPAHLRALLQAAGLRATPQSAQAPGLVMAGIRPTATS